LSHSKGRINRENTRFCLAGSSCCEGGGGGGGIGFDTRAQ